VDRLREPYEYPLTQGRVILGRTTENDIQLDSKFVSRHHAQLTVSPRAAVLEDLNSTNGVYFLDRRIKRHTLRDGETFVIGDHELLYRVGGPPARTPASGAEPEEEDLPEEAEELQEDED